MHRLLTCLGMAGWIACGAAPFPAPAPVPVRPGIEVLLTDSLGLVRGRRVALLANRASVDAHGVADAVRLRQAGVNLVALMAPEHGYGGTAAPGAPVATTTDSVTGLPIYSFYGPDSKGVLPPQAEIVLIDLPDVGARYFTYLSTAVDVIRAAARSGVPVVVLDRPDPIGGVVQGNVLDTAYRSAVGLLAVPMRYGLTLGELVRLAIRDLNLPGRVSVVPADGWRRGMTLAEAGLPFERPSPNLPTLESLYHYPGLCLFEGTNLSVGRGSDAPFEQIGAPWLDPARVLQRLNREPHPGVDLEAVRFTPRHPGDGKYAGIAVRGIRLRVTDRAAYDPTRTAVQLLAAIRAAYPDSLRWIPSHFDRLAGTSRLRLAIMAGKEAGEIMAPWEDERARYLERRKGILLYGE